jgi:uncharacterized protein (TIGR00255 family)
MLQSMTGFGSATAENEQVSVTVEVKTLNSKFTDINCRIPRNFSNREIELRKLLSDELERGKIEMSLNVTNKDASAAGTVVNRPVLKAYYNDLFETSRELGFDPSPTDLLRMASMMPNAYITNTADEESAAGEWEFILKAVEIAIERCQEFRVQEGEATKVKFREYIGEIADLLDQVEAQDPARIPVVRERLEKAVVEWSTNESFDQNRFEQELIYFVEKLDISEEKVRLANHLKYFIEQLDEGTNGKKLNFISQELGREINTIGSKANDATIQRLVVQMKDYLEKIKEQTMNIV